MPKICLITPGHLSTNPRLVKEANALSEAGYQVGVISASYSRWGRDADPSCTSTDWIWIAALPFGPLAPWLIRLRHLVVVRTARWLWQVGVKSHHVATAAWHPLCGDLIKKACETSADLYIAHYPAALPAAAIAAKRHCSLYVFDAEDYHLGDPPDDQRFELQRSLTRCIEAKWLNGCAFMTAASAGIADAYASTYGLERPTVIRNVFPISHAASFPTPTGSCSPRPTIYWFSQTIGPNRGLECAVRAIALAKSKPHLHLRGSISPSYQEQLISLAKDNGVAGCLHFHPPAEPEQMEALAAAYDVGLVSETGCTKNRRIALTNKLFTYALAGLPMLLSDIPAHRSIKDEAGNAVRMFHTDDHLSLAQAIDQLLNSSPVVLAEARQAAYRLGQEQWNWELEQVLLLRRISEAFHRSLGTQR